MSGAINLLIGWNPHKEFHCVVCGLPFGEPISHLKMHMTQTDFRCIDCNVKCGELTAGYDSFVNHVEQARHLNYQFTCMECNVSETDFPKYMQHLQMHNEEDPKLPDIKTEDSVTIKEGTSMTSAQSGQVEATEVCTVRLAARLESCYEAIDQAEIMHKLPNINTMGFAKFQCPVCDVLVPKAKEHAHMQMHLKDTTVEMEMLSGRIRFACKLCKFKSKTEYSLFLRMHVKFHEEAAKENKLKGSTRIQAFRPLYTFDTCRICVEQQEGPDSLFAHVIQHFPNSVFYCRVCFKIYNDYKSCRDHFNSHNLKLGTNNTFGVYFLCPVCGHLEIPNNSKIIDHVTRHSSCWYSKGAFVCKPITANLLKFEHCWIAFDDTISSCNFKCDDAASLCSHVLRHMLSVTVRNNDNNRNERQIRGRKKLSTAKTKKSPSRQNNDSKEIVPVVSKIENLNDESSCQERFDNVQSLCKYVPQHIIRSKGNDEHIVSAQNKKDDDIESSVDIDFAQEEYVYEVLNRSQVQALGLTHFFSSTSTGESKCVLCESVPSPGQLYDHVDSHMKNAIIEREKNHKKWKFTCKLCSFVTHTGYVQFLKHLKYHEEQAKLFNGCDSCGTRRQLLFCNICRKKSKSEEHLFEHILSHYPETVFYCRICFRSYKDFKTCKQHYVAHKGMTHKESAYGIYLLCPVCGELETPNPTWKILRHLIFHFHSHEYELENGNFVSKPRKGRFECKKLSAKCLHNEYCHVVLDDRTCSCEFKCDDAPTLDCHFQEHVRYYKPISVNTVNTQTSPSTCTCQENDAKQSELCQGSFAESVDRKSPVKSLLPVEQQTSGKEKDLKTFATDSVTLLNSYHDNITKKSCIICGGTSKIKGDMFEHVCVHFPDNVFYCRYCFKTFRNFLSAVKHSREHYPLHTVINHFEAWTVGFICSLCGYNDLSSRKKFIIAHLFQHYDQTKDPEFGCQQKHFLCRQVTASLICYKYFVAEFDSATACCEEEFDDVDSLCDHIKQHIVKSTVTSDSESTASTSSRPSEKIFNVNHEVVEPPCDLSSGRSVAIQFSEANTSNTGTSQLSVEQCDVAEVDIKDERDSLGQSTTFALNAIKKEKVETLQSNYKESRQSVELMDLSSSTFATTSQTSQKISRVPSTTHASVPYSSSWSKASLALNVGPCRSLGSVQPKVSSKFGSYFPSYSKRTFETVFTSDSQPAALKEVKLDVLEEQECKQSTGYSKIIFFVCEVCGKRFMGEHFLQKHMSKH